MFEASDIELSGGKLVARGLAMHGASSPKRLCDDLAAHRFSRTFVNIGSLDLLLVRLCPIPVRVLALLAMLEGRGLTVANATRGLTLVQHKGWLAQIPGAATPRSTMTRNPLSAQIFFEQSDHGVVLKPVVGSGGHGVRWIESGRKSDFEEAFFASSSIGMVLLQDYLPAAKLGEKRVVWCDGDALGAYLRTRAPGEFRHNLKQGATPSICQVTPAEIAALQTVRKPLLDLGVRLAGVDMIGGKIIEVNACNPGGVVHAQRTEPDATDLSCEIMRRLTTAKR